MIINDARSMWFPPNACADLDNLPGESLVSALWRFAWRNGLDARTLLPYCSEKGYDKESIRPVRSQYDRERFAKASGWHVQDTENTVRNSGNEKLTSLWWSEAMRYCPICLEQLYHSYWHQCEFLSHCPFDGAPLLNHCYRCKRPLPKYGFHRTLLNRPYTCSACRKSISGVNPSVHLRAVMQARAGEIGDTVDALERWWGTLSQGREQIERLLHSRSWLSHASWLRPDTSLRQWVVSMAPAQAWPSIPNRTIPPLVVLKWRARLLPPDPLAWIWAKRRGKSKYERLKFARQVYRATLRRLASSIAVVSPFSDAEYRRYLLLKAEDLVVHPRGCNLHLLALVVLRKTYESFFSIFEGVHEEANLDESTIGFPYGNEFAERVRICWRAQFIAEYASIYWVFVAVRNGRPSASNTLWKSSAMYNANVEYDCKSGDMITGSVAFPAVDGLKLELFL